MNITHKAFPQVCLILIYYGAIATQISDLNQINDLHRARVQELETANKEFRRHMAVCEASDSAPSSSGVSSIPMDTMLKQTCDDVLQEYHPYNVSSYARNFSARNSSVFFTKLIRQHAKEEYL